MSGSERSLKMLAAALEKEEKGRDFYREAGEKSSNSLGKEFFRNLIIEEGVHISRIKKIYDALAGGAQWTSEWKAFKGENEDLQVLIKSRAADLKTKVTAQTDDIQALDIASSMEQAAITFYEDQLEQAQDDIEREFIELMVREERNHFASLQDLKLFFSDPETFNMQMEKSSLDG